MKIYAIRFIRSNASLALAVMFASFFSAGAPKVHAQSSTTVINLANLLPGANPEIVRLSYVQGDVRFSRGDGKTAELSKSWEQALANLPILQGYAVATGDGRAEIEFEYGSTVYLAENSVLIFQTLLTNAQGVPSTTIELVTGTATANITPVPGELFDLLTPTDLLRFPAASFMRVDSFLDAIGLTPQQNGLMGDPKTSGGALQMAKGQTSYYRNGLPISVPPTDQPAAPADWDSWVAARVAQRQADTAAALKASGLPSFVPGLTDLYNGGTFFSCAPYGMCWEPKDLPDAAQNSSAPHPTMNTTSARTSSGSLQLVAMRVGGQQPGAQQTGASSSQSQPQGAPPSGQKPKPQVILDYYYPLSTCPPSEVHVYTVKDPKTGKETTVQEAVPNTAWTWALCHTGAWVHLQKRKTHYTFVVGKKRHHPPVHWIHTRNGDAWVPRHPSDAKGQPLLNLSHGIFEAKKGPAGPVELVKFNPKDPYTLLPQAPKDFLNPKYPQLAETQRPDIHARLLADGSHPADKDAKSEITYDYKSRNFMKSGAPVGGRTGKAVVVAGLGPHGGSGSGGRTSGGGGKTSGGGTTHAGGSGGGGSHSGGGGGGSHAGGGGGGSHAGGGGGGGGGSHGGGGGGGGSGRGRGM